MSAKTVAFFKTVRGKYYLHAGQRKFDRLGNRILMKLTFEEWWKIWEDSGKWNLRGCKRGCFQMGRFDDLGHYEKGNVKIISVSENTREGNLTRHLGKLKKPKQLEFHF